MADVYALYGEVGDPLIIPPGWQMADPFGSSIGPVNPAFFGLAPEIARYVRERIQKFHPERLLVPAS